MRLIEKRRGKYQGEGGKGGERNIYLFLTTKWALERKRANPPPPQNTRPLLPKIRDNNLQNRSTNQLIDPRRL